MPTRPSPLRVLVCALVLAASSSAASAALPPPLELRAWIEGFKSSPKGPFERIRWFCRDGAILPPKAYACAKHGGGIQHGEWNQRAKTLRAGGYEVANVLASLDPKTFVGGNADLWALQQILLERFLIGWDDGWIFRGARTYRGALQIEDEEAGARAVVHAMLGDRAWLGPERFLLLRESVRLLPLQTDEDAADDVRRQALVLAGRDKSFDRLRAKIHNQPDARDAAKVREYARSRGPAALRGEYERLASGIDALYSGSSADELALALAPKVANVAPLSSSLEELGRKLRNERDPATRIAIAGRLMALVRKHLPEIASPEAATEALQLSVVLETDGYNAARTALPGAASLARERRLELLDQTGEALYGAGLIHLDQLADVKKARQGGDVAALAAAPGQVERSLNTGFGRAVEHLAPLEPEARQFARDRIQVSLLPFYRGVVEGLR